MSLASEGLTFLRFGKFASIMKANPKFLQHDKQFWANVRTIGQELGYTRNGQVRVYHVDDLKLAMTRGHLKTDHFFDPSGRTSELAAGLIEYFTYQAEILNNYVEPRLMDASRAEDLFNQVARFR